MWAICVCACVWWEGKILSSSALYVLFATISRWWSGSHGLQRQTDNKPEFESDRDSGQLTPDMRLKLRCFNHQHWQNLFTSFTQVTIVTSSSIPWLTSTFLSNLGFSQLNEPDQVIFKMHHYLKHKAKANQALSKLAPHYDPVTAVSCFRFPLDEYHKFSVNDVIQEEIICKECCRVTLQINTSNLFKCLKPHHKLQYI